MGPLGRLGIAALACAWVSAARLPESPSLHRASRRLMGTFFEIQAYDSDGTRAARAMAAALDEAERVDRLLSNYDPRSELSAMNREASRAPYRVSNELFDFVAQCRTYFASTRHAFDPTVGPLVRAWGFFTPHPAKPSDAEIAKAAAASGFANVQLDAAARTVHYSVPGLELDPGGIGKGYAVDRMLAVLVRAGIDSALVSAGGSTLYGLGRPPDRPGWRVAIKDPIDASTPVGFVMLHEASLSTSGVSEKSVEVGSRRFAHVFDPRRGEPVEGMCQATVLAPTATASDALSKPAFILSRDEVVAVVKDLEDVHVLRVEGSCGKGRTVWTTPWSTAAFAR